MIGRDKEGSECNIISSSIPGVAWGGWGKSRRTSVKVVLCGFWDMNGDSSVGILTRLGAGQPRNFGSISYRGTRCFSLLQNVRTGCDTHPILSYFPPWVKRPGRVVDHSPSFRAEVKNEWNISPPPPPSACEFRPCGVFIYCMNTGLLWTRDRSVAETTT